uniref:Uncharacterized protein n=1 Tax=Meloidogyne floridensis TaxID=298350 RepID=A0A915NY30_9BILA
MLNPNWLNDAIANTKQRTSSLAVNGPAAYDLQQQQQRPSSAHSFPSLFPQNTLQQEQNDFQQQMISQQGQGQQGSQMQPLSSR